MTTKEMLHQLVEQIPDEHLEMALATLENLNDNEPMSEEALADLDQAMAEAAAGQLKPLEQYKRERGIR
jgi:hypothetical protein